VDEWLVRSPDASAARRVLQLAVVLVAIALATFWPLQDVAGRLNFQFWDWETALHGAVGFLSMCLLSGGLEMMRRANNTPVDDSWEFWS